MKDMYKVSSLMHLQYLQHRQRLRNVVPRVDTSSPKVRLTNIREASNLIGMKEALANNIKMIKQIITITADPDLRTFNQRKIPIMNNREHIDMKLKMLDKENYKFGCRLLNAKPFVETRHYGRFKYADKPKDTSNQIKIPERIFNAYAKIVSEKSLPLLKHLLRPIIYFDLAVEDISEQSPTPLGRVKIQLCTEACPSVVLQFVRIFAHHKSKAIKFLRIFSTLWVEGEMKVENAPSKLEKSKLLFNNDIIDHQTTEGVLSFSKKIYKRFQNNLLNFAISFREISADKCDRMAIGVVIQGMPAIKGLQAFGTTHGSTRSTPVILNCGVE
ncbi:uncharacterized protein LOC119676903 [Teleopsis dalmanni]|uniref:uncharacterized protein LOC119676903 n=1 Tax=Teleopsis dalmanni TaxID=139649 RepID=UPI0018CE0F46|nr:uncharacterized protein LOC119676903 [Teleopsis dalmanni]